MMYNVLLTFVLFLTYSVIGWMIEVAAVSNEKKRFVRLEKIRGI